MFNVNNRNTRTSCEICSKLTIKTPEQCGIRTGIFIVKFEHVSHLVLVFLLLILVGKFRLDCNGFFGMGLLWLRCNDFIAMASLQRLCCNGFHFSRLSLFSKKATIFLDDALYRKILPLKNFKPMNSLNYCPKI